MSAGCSQHHPRRILGTREIRILIQSGQKGLLTPLGSHVALNASWARRAGVISHLPRSARVANARTRHSNKRQFGTCVGVRAVAFADSTMECP